MVEKTFRWDSCLKVMNLNKKRHSIVLYLGKTISQGEAISHRIHVLFLTNLCMRIHLGSRRSRRTLCNTPKEIKLWATPERIVNKGRGTGSSLTQRSSGIYLRHMVASTMVYTEKMREALKIRGKNGVVTMERRKGRRIMEGRRRDLIIYKNSKGLELEVQKMRAYYKILLFMQSIDNLPRGGDLFLRTHKPIASCARGNRRRSKRWDGRELDVFNVFKDLCWFMYWSRDILSSSKPLTTPSSTDFCHQNSAQNASKIGKPTHHSPF